MTTLNENPERMTRQRALDAIGCPCSYERPSPLGAVRVRGTIVGARHRPGEPTAFDFNVRAAPDAQPEWVPAETITLAAA